MNSNYANKLFQLGMIAGQQGKLDEAANYFIQAAETNASDLEFLMKIGEILENMQRPTMAANVYREIVNKNMRHVNAFLGFGRVLMQLSDYKTAVQCFEQANKLQPGEKATLARLCKAYWAVDENEKGVAAIKEAYRLGIAPEFYFVYLADHYEKINDLENLGEVLKEGLKVCPDYHALLVLSGIYYSRAGEYEKALKPLLRVMENKEYSNQNIRIHFELGQVYNKLENYKEAYKYFLHGNKISVAKAKLQNKKTNKGRKFIKNVEGIDFSGWEKVSADTLEGPENNPIFLVGFPRSGTTLLNRILDSHRDIECIEEERILYATKAELTTKYGSYFHALKDLTKEQLNDLRDTYLEQANTYRKTGSGIFMVDKFPLVLVELPFIIKLFPKSKIILALRHPCDCALSCFMQNFDLNQAMLNFLNLDDATSYYNEIMKQWIQFCEELKFDHYQFKYENLVQNPEEAIRNLVKYLELDWDPDIMNFTKKAAEIGRIKTPSYSQVVKPIYKDAKDRWRNYEDEMAPYLDRLKPYCDRFGYKI